MQQLLTLNKQLVDSILQNAGAKILVLEEQVEKLSKENKQKKQTSKQTLAELKKSREDLTMQKNENGNLKKDFAQKMRDMNKVVDQHKSRIEHLGT